MPGRTDKRTGICFYRFKFEKQSYFKSGFRTETEAKSAEIQLKAALIAGKKQPSKDIRTMLFGSASQIYHDEHGKKLDSYGNIKARLPVICEYFSGQRFLDVDRTKARKFLDWVKAELDLSDHTVNHYQAHCKAVYNWWIKEKEADIPNPFAFKALKVAKAKTRFMLPAEEKLISPAVATYKNGELWPYYFTALHTGLRLENVAMLQVKNVDFTLGQIFVVAKGRISGYVPIHPDLYPWLKLWSTNLPPEAYLLGIRHKCTVTDWFSEVTDACGFPDITFHTLRHTFAWFHLQRGEPLYRVSKWLLHRNQKTTEDHYGHMVLADLKPGAFLPQRIITFTPNGNDKYDNAAQLSRA